MAANPLVTKPDDQLVSLTGALTQESFAALCRQLNEPPWLRERRQEAWRRFTESGPMTLPTDKGQKTLAPLRAGAIVPQIAASREPGPADTVGISLERPIWGDLAGSHLTSNATVCQSILADTWREQGVVLIDFDEAIHRFPDLVEQHFMDPITDPVRLQLGALQEAFRSGGVFLYVPRGVDVTLPLHLGHRLTDGGVGVFPYTLIIADQESRLSVIDDVGSSDEPEVSLVNSMVDIHLKAGAQLRYYHLQHWGSNVYHYLQQRAFLERDASITTFSALTGGQLTYAYTETNLRGQGSQGLVLGLVCGDRNQAFLARTVQNHVGPHTTSDLLVKAVLKGEAHSDYSGWIMIEKQAVKADAYQLQRNLLLSPKAKANSIPNLEILANDVRCSHGAAVGSIDEEQLFYLRSRGLPADLAERMVVEGFAEQVILRIPEAEIRERIRRILRSRLGFAEEE